METNHNNKQTVGRPKNPLWDTVIKMGMFQQMTNPEIKKWLEEKGFVTHLVNVTQMRKRLIEKGVDAVCERKCPRGRRALTSVPEVQSDHETVVN